MIIEKNGIKIDAKLNGHQIVYTVLEQSKKFDEILADLKVVHDPETGLSLRSNKHPSFNKAEKRFFVRGTDKEKHTKKVVAGFPNERDAKQGLEGLKRLVEKVVPIKYEHRQIKVGDVFIWEGGTAAIRFSFLNRAMAQELQLTGCDQYPLSVMDWKPMKPFYEENVHAREHLFQAVDICNKSVMTDKEYRLSGLEENIINQHRVSPTQAKKAVIALRKAFQDAFQNGYIVAFWRLVTSLRSNDANY